MDTVEQVKATILKILEPVTVRKVVSVEKDLSPEDIISLYFLLNDNPKKTLQVLKSGRQGIVSDWCREFDVKNVGEWRLRLIESLALMQLFKSLERLGYKKRSFAEVHKFLDMASRSRDFDVRKALYNAVDTLTETELEQFIYCMDKGRVRRTPEHLYRPRHIELFLLEWQIDGKIGLETESLNYVVALFDQIKFTSASESLRRSIVDLDNLDNPEDFPEEDPAEELSTSLQSASISPKHYPIINPQEVGVCIILNQKNYLLSSQHKVRRGSEKDCSRLRKTMGKMNIKCFELHDLRAKDIFPEIIRLVRSVFNKNVHSVLFVVIMAHGNENQIFGVAGGAVKTMTIGEILSSAKMPFLKDIPKVIIFQSCRGNNHLDASNFERDGPEEIKSWMDNYIICYSNIPGCSSFRSPDEGSVYIQQLCECLESMYKDHHFVSILMKVTAEFSKKPNIFKVEDRTVGMKPESIMSLTKKLFLYPPHSSPTHNY